MNHELRTMNSTILNNMKTTVYSSRKKTTANIRDLFWIILAIVTFTACNETTVAPKKIEPDIPQEKMIQILKDVHLAEAIAQSERTNVKDSLLAIYYEDIYRIHNITKEDLERNLKLWMNDAEVVDKLYEKVIEELSKEESEYANRKPLSPINNKKPKVLKEEDDGEEFKQKLDKRTKNEN